MAIHLFAIFAIMAKMARMAKKFIAIFRHSYYFFPKIDGEMAMSPPILLAPTWFQKVPLGKNKGALDPPCVKKRLEA